MHKFLHHIKHIHHTVLHIGELFIIATLGWSSLLFANYNVSYESFHRANMAEVNKYLLSAEKIGKPEQNNLISTRNIDQSVNNTFAAGYCTYGAARISPEFFPLSWNTQQRTRGGNAIDRCDNASKAGFKIGSNASVGALVVYNAGNGVSALWHVGKVMYYNNRTNNMIVRDMNRIIKWVMADHRDNTKTANIKCFIYPNKTVQTEIPEEITDTPVIETGIIIPVIKTGIVSPIEVIPPIIIKPTTGTVITTGTTTKPEIIPETKPTTPIPEENHNAAQNLEQEKPVNETNTTIETSSNIKLNIENISDISKHFMDQYDFTITKTSTANITAWDTITITITAKEKTTNTSYQGILPFSINILTSNNNITASTSRIQMLQWNEFIVSVKAIKSGDASIIFTIDDTKVAQISVKVN